MAKPIEILDACASEIACVHAKQDPDSAKKILASRR